MEDSNQYRQQRIQKNQFHLSNSSKPYAKEEQGIEEPVKICYEFKNKGFCKFGMRCRYKHTIDTPYQLQTPSKNQSEKYAINKVKDLIHGWENYKLDEEMLALSQEAVANAKKEKMEGFKYSDEEYQQIAKIPTKDISVKENTHIVIMGSAMAEASYFQKKYCKNSLLKRNYQKLKQNFRYLLLKDSNEFMDPPLHQYGINQCTESTSLSNKINFSLVFVSPLRRTMETAVELFKSHPKKDQIEFIVFPQIAQLLKKDSDIFIEKEFNQIVEMARKKHGIEFNIKTFYTVDWQERILNSVFHFPPGVLKDPYMIKKMITAVFPQPLEKFKRFTNRAISAFQTIKEYQKQIGGVVGVLTHSLIRKIVFENEGVQESNDDDTENITFDFYTQKQ